MMQYIKLLPILFIAFTFSCISNQETKIESNIESMDSIAQLTKETDKAELHTNNVTEILEVFVDSLQIGVKGENKIELIKYRVFDDNYVIVKYYSKTPEQMRWYLQNTYSYECNALMNLDTDISDYNNDGYNDITFVSATAARGANEVRRLFIYDKNNNALLSIVNAQDYPNMQYNPTLNCIDAFMIHGNSTSVFAKISGDSLVTFATVQNTLEYHIVNIIDKNGNEKELYKTESTGDFVRHKTFQPLVPYEY